MVPFESLGAVFYSPSIVTMALSCSSSAINTDIGRKSWYFHTPLHSAPPLGKSPSEYCHRVWCGKTRMVGLPDGWKRLRICVTVFTQYRRVTDGQTNGQTFCHGIVCAMHTRCAVKTGLETKQQQTKYFWCFTVQSVYTVARSSNESWKTNRNSYEVYQMMPFPIILSDPEPMFQSAISNDENRCRHMCLFIRIFNNFF